MGDDLVIQWKAFPLRPEPDPSVTFKGTYREEGWRRCGAMARSDGITFTPWARDDYPNWSLPALEAATCVALQSAEAFDRLHVRLYEAFFGRSINIAKPEELVGVVKEAGADMTRFLRDWESGAARDAVSRDYEEALTRNRVRAPSLPLLQPRARLRPSAQGPRGDPRARGRHRHRAPLHGGAPGATPPDRHAELTRLPLPFYDNRLLFGRAAIPGQVAFEASDETVRVYSQEEVTRASDEPFRPFLLLTDPDLLKGFKGEATVVPLDGDGAYRWLAGFRSWAHCAKARDHCQQLSGRAAGAAESPYRFLSDPVHQFLLRTGRTSFLGMAFQDLRRMAVDIEVTTAPGFEFPNAARESDRIIAIAIADSGGFTTVLSGAEMEEADLLRECGRIIGERDPDVLEGHNIFRFDLEYMEARA